jgi:predicted permease
LQGARTSWNLPQVLGVKPIIGRVFTEEEQTRGADVAVLSYGLWERRFGRDHGLIGRTIQLNGTAFEVIGVMPPEYRYPSREFELWTPLHIGPDEIQLRLGYDYIAVGRLKPGVTIEQAQAEMSTIMRRLGEQYPEIDRTFNTKLGVLVEPLIESTVGQVRTTLYLLFAAVGCLLLTGCVNLGNLLLARANARTREIAVRAALGAGSGRLQRQMLAELLPLSAAGIAGGLLLASWLLQGLMPFLPPRMPRVEAIGLNAPVVLFAFALSVLVILVAGLLPARRAAQVDLNKSLRQDSRTMSGTSEIRNALVVTQVAVSLALLFGSGLLVRSLQTLLHVNPGFATGGVLTMHLAVTRAKYPNDADVAAYCRRVLDRVRSISGVTAAGMVNRLPLSGIDQTGPVEFEGRTEAGNVNADWRSATPGYFETLGIPLLRGRAPTEDDTEGSLFVGVIDAQLSKQVFAGADPLGKRFRITAGTYRGPWTEIVGVVGHIRNDGLEKDLRPQIYWPYRQRMQDRMVLAVRTSGRPEGFTTAVVEQIRKEDAEQPVYDIRSMGEWLTRSLQQRHLLTGMVSMFGAASLLLACLGLYGAISYSTGLRLREFGIRIALGADSSEVRRLVLRQAGWLVLAGTAAGLVLVWPVGIALRSFLYGVGGADPVALAGAALILAAVGLFAGWGPARKAARLDPATVLRAD